MIYGDGDGRTFTALSGANDVVAHEITWCNTANTNLVYRSQSGALNESFSECGCFVDDEDFLMGEDVYTPGVGGDARSLSPERFGQPSHMNDFVYTNSAMEAYIRIQVFRTKQLTQFVVLVNNVLNKFTIER